jgi:hypothetical protein
MQGAAWTSELSAQYAVLREESTILAEEFQALRVLRLEKIVEQGSLALAPQGGDELLVAHSQPADWVPSVQAQPRFDWQ